MSSPYVCASCRQWLRRRAQRLLRTQWRSKVDNAPFSRLLTPSSNSTPTANFPLPIQQNAKRDGRQEQQQRDGGKQDNLSWNLEELFAGRMGPGRYSAAFLPEQFDSSAKRDSPTELQPEIEGGWDTTDRHHSGKPSVVEETDYLLEPDGSLTINDADPIETATKNNSMDAAQLDRVASLNMPARPSSRQRNSHDLFDRLFRDTAVSKADIWIYVTENPGVDSLQNMFDQFKPVSATQDWQYLLEHAEDIRKLGSQSQQALIRKISTNIWRVWRQPAETTKVPAPSEVLAEFIQNGLPCTDIQLQILFDLHLQIARTLISDSPLTAFRHPTDLISETMCMWKIWIKSFADESAFKNSTQGLNAFEWSNFSSAIQNPSQKFNSKRFDERFFGNLVPHFPNRENQLRVAAAAFLLSILYRRGFLAPYMQPSMEEEISSFTNLTMDLSQDSDIDLVLAFLEGLAVNFESKKKLQRILNDAGYRSTWPMTQPPHPQEHAHRQLGPAQVEELNVGSYKASPDEPFEGHHTSEPRKKNFHERRASLQATNRQLKSRDSQREQLQTKGQQDSNIVDRSDRTKVANQRREPDGAIMIKRLGRALEQTDLSQVDRLWRSMSRLRPSEGQESSVSKSKDVYEAFIFTYMRLGVPNQAINVWNEMVNRGVQPTVISWTSMMKGCRLERDADSLEALWQRMRDSGVQPDARAWTTRLYGLIRGDKVKEGLQGLREMANEYTAASRRISANPSKATEADKAVPKPNIQTINAVIMPLSRGPMEQAIQDVLAWAARRGIKPDAFTFNIRITIALRQNDITAAFRLLKEMSAQNVQPNIATFTMLLDNLMKDPAISTKPPEEQQNLVMTYLTELERHGFAATTKSYNLLLDRLLKLHNNPTAARAVLAHM
ncbi:MAG: hypothetical protein Q9157_007372, partial [Trypethelium eluteriae]